MWNTRTYTGPVVHVPYLYDQSSKEIAGLLEVFKVSAILSFLYIFPSISLACVLLHSWDVLYPKQNAHCCLFFVSTLCFLLIYFFCTICCLYHFCVHLTIVCTKLYQCLVDTVFVILTNKIYGYFHHLLFIDIVF